MKEYRRVRDKKIHERLAISQMPCIFMFEKQQLTKAQAMITEDKVIDFCVIDGFVKNCTPDCKKTSVGSPKRWDKIRKPQVQVL